MAERISKVFFIGPPFAVFLTRRTVRRATETIENVDIKTNHQRLRRVSI
jgi:hypothetical protein